MNSQDVSNSGWCNNCHHCGIEFVGHYSCKYCSFCRNGIIAETHRAKEIALTLVRKAIESGELQRPNSCELCNSIPSDNVYSRGGLEVRRSNIVAHHANGHNNPLCVWWICTCCNLKIKGPLWHSGTRTRQQAIDYIQSKRPQEAQQ